VNNKGSILITTFWILIILSMLAAGIGFRASLEARLSIYQMDKIEALYLARAGVLKAREVLAKDTNKYDTLYACGISFEEEGDEEETPEDIFAAEFNELGTGAFAVYYDMPKEFGELFTVQYGMMDEERKININISKIPDRNVDGFKEILGRLSPKLTSEIVNAIVDWQDMDEEVTFPGGAEETYYAELEHPYKCKNGDFTFIEELLLVKGMTEEVFDEIKGYITVYGEGKININTAPREVLNAVLNNEDNDFSSLADKVINYRQGEDGASGTEDDLPITTLSDIPGDELSPEESARLSSRANYFVFVSNNFRIIAHGKKRKVTKTLTYIVDKKTAEIIYYHEG
jgi:general secretion pathway protein K